MTFSLVAMVTSVACLLLGLGFLFAGTFMLQQWGIQANQPALLVSRRIGAVYLGISLLLFLGRAAPPSDLRFAICAGIALATGLLACLGLFELQARRASSGILVSVVVEILLTIGFLSVMWG